MGAASIARVFVLASQGGWNEQALRAAQIVVEKDGGTVTYTFTVPVNPVGKGRPRFTRSGHTYTPARTTTYEQHVAAAAQQASIPVLDCQLSVWITFYVEPQRGGPSDLDNYIKAVLDGLKAHFNDRRVVELAARRVDTEKGTGRADVVIVPLPTVHTVTAQEWAARPDTKPPFKADRKA